MAPQPISSPSNAYYAPPPIASSSNLYYPPPPQQQYPTSEPQPQTQFQPQPYPQQQPMTQQSPNQYGPNSDFNQPGPSSQMPNYPGGSTIAIPRPPQQTMSPALAEGTTTDSTDIRAARTSCQFALREYIALQKRRQRVDASTSAVEVQARIRAQAGIVLGDLKVLQVEVKSLVKAAENHRWRKWVVGGAIASFIPAVRKLFRRNTDDESDPSSNDTEYAFRKSQGLLSRIKDSVLGGGGYASVAFFVFAVLYVFQNEVSLRVAKTAQRRIRRLCERIERGGEDVDEGDMRALEGWRWRVILW